MKPIRAVSHRQVMGRLLKDQRFRRGYEEEFEKLRIVDAIINLRQRQGMTQKTLARRLKVSQPFIAKLEKAETHNFTLDTLIKVVTALNGELVIHIKPRKARLAIGHG
ncbi:MAG: XRE family transcriptional regulator [Candidatus Omnitrophica bacterium]|nr:XRE family transcriptional regulator [Candidatus Omnitrophota bacterium]